MIAKSGQWLTIKGRGHSRFELGVQSCIYDVCFLNLDNLHVYSLYVLYTFVITEIFHNKTPEEINFQFWDGLVKSIYFPKGTDKALNFLK